MSKVQFHSHTFLTMSHFNSLHYSQTLLGLDFICTHCLKIAQNVAFEFLNFGIFHQFCPIKAVSGNTV